jgi:uncharacterized membrane protein (GlpM family)
VIEYWVDKALLLFRHTRPKNIGTEISELMSRLVPFAIFLYALFLWADMLLLEASNATYLTLVWMFAMLIYLFIPTDLVLSYFSKR